MDDNKVYRKKDFLSIGDKVIIDNDQYLICQVDTDIIAAIGMNSFNRYETPIKVDNIYHIDHYDFLAYINQNGTPNEIKYDFVARLKK